MDGDSKGRTYGTPRSILLHGNSEDEDIYKSNIQDQNEDILHLKRKKQLKKFAKKMGSKTDIESETIQTARERA